MVKKIISIYTKEHGYIVLLLMLLSVANIIVSTLCPLLERALIDQGLAALSLTNTMYYVTAITIVLLSSKLIEYLTVSLESNLQKSITQKCKSNVINHAFKLKMTCYNEYGFYKQLADALSDTDRLLSFSESCIIAIVGNFVKILGAFIALISINWRLLLLVIAFIPIKILVASHHQIMLGLQCDKTIEAAKSFGNWVNRSAMSINDSKLWNMHNYVCKKGEEKINTLTTNNMQLILLKQKRFTSIEILDLLMISITYFMGFFLIEQNLISLGGVFAFVSYISYLHSPIDILVNLQLNYKETLPSIICLQKFWESKEEQSNGISEVPSITSISCEDISLKINNKWILKNVSFSVLSGDRVAVIGDNGSGKTSLIYIIMRMHDITNGKLKINNVNIDEYSVDKYRERFSVVSQKGSLFEGSIKLNITLSDEDYNYNTLGNYIDKYRLLCNERIKRDFLATNSLNSLSGGELQRILLLRALYFERDVLIIDEGETNLDSKSKKAINDIIKNEANYNILIVVTHNEENLNDFNVIIELEKGEIKSFTRRDN